jgi:phospholipase C
VPTVTAAFEPGAKPALMVHLANEGQRSIAYTLTRNDYEGTTQTVSVAAGGGKTIKWAADREGYYDVIVTANTGDGFTYRYAGRIAKA